MNTEYFLRCTEADKPNLYALAVKLGVLAVSEWDPTGRNIKDEATDTETDELAPVAYTGAGGCAWDEIGPIYLPTGNKVMQDNGEGETFEVDEVAPSTDSEGAVYFHANLSTPVSLGQLAESLYAETQDATLGAAMQDMSRFFVTDPETGMPRRPKHPCRVFAS